MASRYFQSPLFACLLALHLAHAPIPWWDGDASIQPSAAVSSGRCFALGQPEACRNFWDIDIILLGVAPPRDSDSGPLSERSDQPAQEIFGTAYVAGAVSRAPSTPCTLSPDRLWESVRVYSLAILEQSQRHFPHFRGNSFGTTYMDASPWRVILSVILC